MPSRIKKLSSPGSTSGASIIYVMARDQRVSNNHALIAAQNTATTAGLPLIVVFNLLPHTGYRKREHYEFMVEGLKQIDKKLQQRGIPFYVVQADSPKEFLSVLEPLAPQALYFDFSPLRGPRNWQKSIAKHSQAATYVVDTHNIIPAWVTSDKEEYAAHNIRRKIHRHISDWLDEAPLPQPQSKPNLQFKGLSWDEVDAIVARIPNSGISHGFTSGENASLQQLKAFIETRLEQYAANRNNATVPGQSDLSPYLHFGQISSLQILHEIMKIAPSPPQIMLNHTMPQYTGIPTVQDSINAFIEELVVRKELADNYCYYQPNYNRLEGARAWAKNTLRKHAADPREHCYTRKELENAHTHDELWNATQKQLISTGKMHGYMRMYWAKKILEWSESPDDAIRRAIFLNDTYSIDGGDPNGYTGIMWSIAGVHDRPWFDRDLYGTVRYMARSGADKRFDTNEYIRQFTDAQ